MKLNDLNGRFNRYDERRVQCEGNLAELQAEVDSRIGKIEAEARKVFDSLNFEREKNARLIVCTRSSPREILYRRKWRNKVVRL